LSDIGGILCPSNDTVKGNLKKLQFSDGEATAILAAKSAFAAAHHWIIHLWGLFSLWHQMPPTHMWWLRCSNCKVTTGSCFISSLGSWTISMSGIPHFDCELLVVSSYSMFLFLVGGLAIHVLMDHMSTLSWVSPPWSARQIRQFSFILSLLWKTGITLVWPMFSRCTVLLDSC
jgi:hypothetical protein